jgi:hypothetical protein
MDLGRWMEKRTVVLLGAVGSTFVKMTCLLLDVIVINNAASLHRPIRKHLRGFSPHLTLSNPNSAS